MCNTCSHVMHMSVMIQIRNVPDELHRKLKARAALEGMSMSDYALRILQVALKRPTRQELLARIAERPIRKLDISPADVLREERERR